VEKMADTLPNEVVVADPPEAIVEKDILPTEVVDAVDQ